MAIDFSNCGSDVIGLEINILRHETSSVEKKLFEEFEVEDTWKWVSDHSFSRVALQFPEDMFHVSPIICLELQRLSKGKVSFAVLAEKKYGSCCVDEIGAEHFAANCIIHYGMACLSPHPRFPVKYVFASRPIDLEDFMMQIKSLQYSGEEFIIIYDMAYHHARVKLLSHLVTSGVKFYCPEIVLPSQCDSLNLATCVQSGEEEQSQIVLGRKFCRQKDVKSSRFVYIGADDSFLTTLMTCFNQSSFTLYMPATNSLCENISRSSKMLMKRYYMMEKARESQFVGILVGTLDVSGYANVIDKMKRVAQTAGKKCRVYSPGTLNPAKLANLSEFDAYVLVACPLNTFIDSKEYYQPIVTPYEMILACSQEFRWSSDYKISFEDVLSEPTDGLNNEPVMDVSLLTGRIRKIGIDKSNESSNIDGTLMKSCSSGLVKSSDLLNSRTWQGLQPNWDDTPPSKCVEGSIGTASGYYHESYKNIEDL